LWIGVLLARMLAPADFGVAALATTICALARTIGDVGLGAAVVQRKHLTARHVRTAFTLSLARG